MIRARERRGAESGLIDQLISLANLGLLGNFIGMPFDILDLI